MLRPMLVLSCLAMIGFLVNRSSAEDVSKATPTTTISTVQLDRQFQEKILPMMTRHCHGCHGPDKQEGKLDLSGDRSRFDVVRRHQVWDIVRDRLAAGEMPPKETPHPLSEPDRELILRWITHVRDNEALRNAGDPGVVLARRLSNSEYDNTIRDLTGFDIRPTREFPVDPANEAGFDNSGESLTMSPALLKKYLAAARHVADHIVLKPQGFDFAPHPVIAETDRDKYCVRRIVDFYQRHPVDFADYFHAAWHHRHRHILGDERFTTLKQIAGQKRLSLKYLNTVWTALTEPAESGPLAELQSAWNELPAPKSPEDRPSDMEIRRACEGLRDRVFQMRKELDPKIEKLHVKGQSDGSQPLILWWNRQHAHQRMNYTGEDQNKQRDAAQAQNFCRVFPNAFAITSRGHYADQKLGAEVRLLTAGFHLMQGYFRDDAPLCELVLTDDERAELDGLWRELNFITLVPFRQYKDFLFFERAEPPRFAGGPEFDFARPEDKDAVSEAKLTRMREAYLAKAKSIGASDEALGAISTYFETMSKDFRWIEQAKSDAEPTHLDSLLRFADRAYRRPLTKEEQADLLSFYRQLRLDNGLSHDEALRDSVVSVLLSPHFCFRFQSTPQKAEQAPGTGGNDRERDFATLPLTDNELASRMSYFLWASMPDDRLLEEAARGTLHQPQVLEQQARRMLRDPKVRGMVVEFTGQWLEIRRFEEHNGVDRNRFPAFTNELRSAMFEEPIQFVLDIVSHDRSVLELLDGKQTFVNPVLAKHYGIPLPEDSGANRPQSSGKSGDLTGWTRIEDARPHQRGGLLPMSVFLTNNSPGLRTSPVKRGYWVVRRLLGEHIPAPPPDVPELPKDEAALGELTLPQMLARHREHTACAGCHQRFDSLGLAFEGFGPVGEKRERDLGGRAVSPIATYPDGIERTGVDGLRQYLIEHRQTEFLDNLTRKLFAYALGRSLQLSDRPTLQEMQQRLKANDHRFSSLIVSIVTSPQFTTKRVEKTKPEKPE